MSPSVIDTLLTLPVMGRAVLAPDGCHVAWTWYRKAPAGDVYISPTDGSAPPRRLTTTPNDTVIVAWTPASDALVVAEDRGGNERMQLFRLTLDGAMTALTEAAPVFFPRGGEIDPTGRFLIFAGNVDPATGSEILPSCVIRQELATGARRV